MDLKKHLSQLELDTYLQAINKSNAQINNILCYLDKQIHSLTTKTLSKRIIFCHKLGLKYVNLFIIPFKRTFPLFCYTWKAIDIWNHANGLCKHDRVIEEDIVLDTCYHTFRQTLEDHICKLKLETIIADQLNLKIYIYTQMEKEGVRFLIRWE
jgi:hypothetical protein